VAALLVRIARRRPDQVLALIGVLAAACGVIVATGEDRLSLGGNEAGQSRLQVHVSGTAPLRSAPSQVALSVMTAQLRANPVVVSVRRGPIGAGGRSTVLFARLRGSPAQTNAAVALIESQLDPGPLRISFAGRAGELQDAHDQAFADLDLLLLAVPLALGLAVLLLGPGGALGAAFALAATALGAGAACVGLGGIFDLSILALAGAGCAGVPGALLASGLAQVEAGPRELWAAALAGAAVFGATALLGLGHVAGFALGGALAFLLSAPLGLTAMTAADEIWGAEGRALPRLRPGRRLRAVRVVLATLALAGLVALALPLMDLDTSALAVSAPPSIPWGRIAAAAGAAALVALVLGIAAGRRPLAMAAGVLAAALVTAAAVGASVLVLQDGRLGFAPGALSLSSVIAVAATVAAASVTCSLASVAEAEAPVWRAVLLAEGVGALAAAALLLSDFEPMRLLGFGVAAGLVLDLVAVRLLLAPALGGLAARRRARVPAR
jgi:hypothetical protein